jgi:isopenicillin N synthase-like dioxygenase
MHENEGLEQILLRSRCHKGRLLYYFPAQDSNCTQDGDSMSSWCGWHTDHGSLTGLTCGMFMRDAVELPCPDSAAGLYIRTRTDQIVKVVFGEDEIAYQIGETTEILSRGYLCATPHCVQAPKGQKASGIDRSTFALFMQPDWDETLNFPDDVHIHKELISSNGALTFGEYTEKLLDKYYHLKT